MAVMANLTAFASMVPSMYVLTAAVKKHYYEIVTTSKFEFVFEQFINFCSLLYFTPIFCPNCSRLLFFFCFDFMFCGWVNKRKQFSSFALFFTVSVLMACITPAVSHSHVTWLTF